MNSRPFGLEPKSSALDHSAKLSYCCRLPSKLAYMYLCFSNYLIREILHSACATAGGWLQKLQAASFASPIQLSSLLSWRLELQPNCSYLPVKYVSSSRLFACRPLSSSRAFSSFYFLAWLIVSYWPVRSVAS